MNQETVPPQDHEHLLQANRRLSPGWRVVLVSVLAMIVGPPPVLIMSFGMFIPEFRTTFGWSVQAIAFGATLISLMLVIVAPLQGYLADRLGSRALILMSMPLFGAALLGMSQLGSNLPLYYLICALLPLAGLGLWPLTYMKIGAEWFDRRLGLALGCLNVGNGLGGAFVPLLVGVLFSHYGWRIAYLVLGALNILVAWPMAALWVRERPVLAARPSAGKISDSSGLSFAQGVRTRNFAIVAGGFFVIGVLSGGFVLHQFNILVEAGIPKRTAIYLQSYLGFTSIVGRLAVGWLMDRVAASRIVVGMLALIAIVLAAFAMSQAGLLTIPCVTVVGLMIGAEMNMLGYLIKRYFGARAFGTLYGLVFALFASGGALGVQVLALSRSQLDSYVPGLLAMAALCLLGSVLFTGLGPYQFVTAARVRAATK